MLKRERERERERENNAVRDLENENKKAARTEIERKRQPFKSRQIIWFARRQVGRKRTEKSSQKKAISDEDESEKERKQTNRSFAEWAAG